MLYVVSSVEMRRLKTNTALIKLKSVLEENGNEDYLT